MILGAKFGLLQRVIEPNEDNIYILAVHPGTVSTDMQEQWKEGYGKLLGGALSGIMYAVGRSPQQGSVSAVWAATSEEVEQNGWNGAYFEDPVRFSFSRWWVELSTDVPMHRGCWVNCQTMPRIANWDEICGS